MKITQRPVALVAFRDKILPARVPVRIGAENRDFRADVMRWMQPAFTQNVRGHGRGRRFSMHANNEDSALATHDGSERFGAAQHRFSRVARAC